MILQEEYNLNLESQLSKKYVKVSQYDTGRRLLITLLKNDCSMFKIPSEASASINGLKPDGKGFRYDCSIENNKVVVDMKEQMTVLAGYVKCEILLSKGGERIATANFMLSVEESPLSENTPISSTDIPLLQKAIEASEIVLSVEKTVKGYSESASKSSQSAQKSAESASNASASSAESARNSSQSAQASAESANSASQSATNAKQSETNASNSAKEAKASADSVANVVTDVSQLKEDIGNIKKKKNVVIYVGSAELSAEQKLSCDYVCDGVDDQIEIDQAISSLPDSGGEVHLSRGIFNISNNITINKRIKLVGEGKGITLDRNNVNNGGTTLLTELTGGCVILIDKSDTLSDIKGITLSDFQIIGAGINVKENYCNGINVNTYTDCVTLERLAFCHLFYGLLVNSTGTADDMSISNCDFQRDACGIYINGKGWQTRIENNIFWDMKGTHDTAGIVLSQGANIINGNYFGVSSLIKQDSATAWITAHDAVSLLCVGNYFSKCAAYPIRFKGGGQFANINGNTFDSVGRANFHENEQTVLYVDGNGTGGGRISFTNNTVFWADNENWKTKHLAYLINQAAQVNVSNNTVIDGIGKVSEDNLVFKSEDSTYAITIGNNVLC